MELESIINVSSNQESTYRTLHEPAIIIGSCFGVVASFLSIYLITKHLRSYTNPAEQKWIVAVLLMVPVYATESVISLSYAKLSLACDILRSCYEAFALYAFGRYLIACLGGEGRVADFLEDNSEKQLSDQSNSEKQLTEPLMEGVDDNEDKQERPFNHFFFRPYTIGEDLLKIEKFGLVQYMILKTVCALLAIVLELFGVYGDGEFEWNCGYPYLAFVMNFSQMWALYCLVQFYNVTHERLKPIKPLAKFISFKAIVFATWWQGVGIALLCTFGVLPKEGKFQTGLQDFLICIEMAIAAVAHIFVFPVESYKFISVAESGKVTAETIKTEVKIEGETQKPTKLEKTETMVKAPGTSIKESVQDIVVEGGQHVVEDVVLTINQAIGPVEKGVTKIQETLHRKSGSNDEDEKETTLEVEEHVEKRNGKDEEEFRIQVEEHVEKIKSQ